MLPDIRAGRPIRSSLVSVPVLDRFLVERLGVDV